MTANQMVQARIDGAIKEETAAVLAAVGLSVSDAVRLLLTRVAQEKALPFEPLMPNAITIQAMKDARAGKVTRCASLDAHDGRSECARPTTPGHSGGITGGRPKAAIARRLMPSSARFSYWCWKTSTPRLVRLGSHAELGL